MARIYNTYEFIGDLTVPKDKDRFISITESTDYKNYRLNFGIKESNTNSAFVEMFGSMRKDGNGKVFSFSKSTDVEKGSKLEILWKDRLKPEMVDMVADFKKYKIDLTEDKDIKNELYKLAYEIRTLEYNSNRTSAENEKLKADKLRYAEISKDVHEFIAEFDMIQYIVENIENLKNKKFKVKGSIEVNEHKGKFYRKFKVESMEIMPNDTRNQLRAEMDIFFDKDAVDDKDFEKDRKIYINGYILSYNNKAPKDAKNKDAFYPQQFVINATKADLTNEEIVNRIAFLKEQFDAKNEEVKHLLWNVSIFRGAEKEELKLEDLTPKQRKSVKLAYNKLEDYNKGGFLGQNKEENRLVKPCFTNDFADGSVLTDYSPDDLFYATTEDEKIEDIKVEPPKETIEETKKISEDFDDIFA